MKKKNRKKIEKKLKKRSFNSFPSYKTHMAQIVATRDSCGHSQSMLPHLDHIALSEQCASESDMFFCEQNLHKAELDYLKREWCVSLQYLDSFEDDKGWTKHVYYKTVTSQFKRLITKRKNQSNKIPPSKIAKCNVPEAALATTVPSTDVLAATELPESSATVASEDANMGTTATVSNMMIEELTDDEKEVASADVACSVSLNQGQQDKMKLMQRMQNVIQCMQQKEDSLTASETTPPIVTEVASAPSATPLRSRPTKAERKAFRKTMQDGGFRVLIDPNSEDSEDSEALKVPDEPPAAAAPNPPIQASTGDAVDAGKGVVAESGGKGVVAESDGKGVVAESTYATTDPTAATWYADMECQTKPMNAIDYEKLQLTLKSFRRSTLISILEDLFDGGQTKLDSFFSELATPSRLSSQIVHELKKPSF